MPSNLGNLGHLAPLAPIARRLVYLLETRVARLLGDLAPPLQSWSKRSTSRRDQDCKIAWQSFSKDCFKFPAHCTSA